MIWWFLVVCVVCVIKLFFVMDDFLLCVVLRKRFDCESFSDMRDCSLLFVVVFGFLFFGVCVCVCVGEEVLRVGVFVVMERIGVLWYV